MSALSAAVSAVSIATVQAAALANKKGKITTAATRAADLVNSMSVAAVLGAAISGKGQIGKTARSTIVGVETLGTMLARPRLDGSQWGDLFGLLAQECGTLPAGTIMGLKAKPRCVAYIKQVRVNLDARFANAETVKAQDLALSSLDRLNIIECEVMRLIEQAEHAAALAAAEQAAAEQAAAEQAAALAAPVSAKSKKATA